MPRSLTANALAYIKQSLGTEPITIVGIFWNGVTELRYADRDILNSDLDPEGDSEIVIPGAILEIGAIDEVIKVEGQASSASVTLILDDADGDLKTILDTANIHKKKVIVYQYYSGLALEDMFILMIGEINTPIIWNDSERKLTLTVLSKIDSREVGFAPEEGQFETVDAQFVGKTWPLAFGEVVHVPAQKVSAQVRGATQSLIGIPDYTLPYKYWHLVERLNILSAGYYYYQNAIYLLNQIAREPWPIIRDYVNTILTEDPLKQRHADLIQFIAENDKVRLKLQQLLREENVDVLSESDMQPINLEELSIGGSYQVDTTLETFDKTLYTQQASENYINQLTGELAVAKNEARGLKTVWTQLDAYKRLLEIETDNAEYAYKTIHAIARKIQKLLIEYVKTNHEIYKIVSIMEEHEKIPQDTVTIIGGNKFPQNEQVHILINNLAFTGTFSGNVFSVETYEPRYTGIKIAPRENSQFDAFWLEDNSINLKGHYCLTTVTLQPGDPEWLLGQRGTADRVFKVIDQIGNKCIIDLVELRPSLSLRTQAPIYPLLEDLPQELWAALRYAKEHTDQERERILENAIEKFDKAELHRIKAVLNKLRDIALQATNDDQIATINETIFKNVHEYNDKVSRLHYSLEDVEKAFMPISEKEFKTLLKLCNLHLRLEDQEFYNEVEVPITRLYYLTGDQITFIQASSLVMLPSWFAFSPGGQELLGQSQTVVTLPSGMRIITDFLPDSGLWYAEPGSAVSLISTETEEYVANTLPSTIASVYAYKSIEGTRQLVPVPSSYYTKNENNTTSYAPLACTTLTLKKPLKDYPGEDWDDNVYVSMSSSVGPLTTDIIEWILANYTNITPDATSFASVASALTNFPSSFALFDKKDALKLIEEICWQARCACWVDDGIMYLRYLSSLPEPVATITTSDILFGSLSLEYTSSDELVTKFVARWQPDYSRDDSKKNKTIVRYNVPLYGEVDEEYDFYIYNDESLVTKSATFWSIRKANTWKIARFRTPLTQLNVATLDCVELDLDPNIFIDVTTLGTEPFRAIVLKADYDSANNTIDFECWLPVRSGEMAVYDFAWPASVAIETIYPSVDDINAGYAGSPHSSIPRNSPFRIVPNVDLWEQLELRPKDYGELFTADGAFIQVASPLLGLRESDYIVARPPAYKMPDQPRMADKEDAKPTYDSPVGESTEQTSSAPFEAEVIAVLQAVNGIYQLQIADGAVITAYQVHGTQVLAIGQHVSAYYDAKAGQYRITTVVDNNVSQVLRVQVERDNWLECVDGDDNKILVAKPFALQQLPFDGKTTRIGSLDVTYEYIAPGRRIARASGEADELQVITPSYFVDDMIITLVARTKFEGVNQIDLNMAGRCWAQDTSYRA